MTNHFDDVSDFDSLICKIRRRFQMWVGDDLSQLRGFLGGFCSARPSIDCTRLREFETFMLALTAEPHTDVTNWAAIVRRRARHPISEIPLFFELYETFSDKLSVEVERVVLAQAERERFLDSDIQGFSRRGIPAPDAVSLRHGEFWGASLKYHLEGATLYELSVASLDRGRELIAGYVLSENADDA